MTLASRYVVTFPLVCMYTCVLTNSGQTVLTNNPRLELLHLTYNPDLLNCSTLTDDQGSDLRFLASCSDSDYCYFFQQTTQTKLLNLNHREPRLLILYRLSRPRLLQLNESRPRLLHLSRQII